jgi:tetratricopeptide (TPR) repeat protein
LQRTDEVAQIVPGGGEPLDPPGPKRVMGPASDAVRRWEVAVLLSALAAGAVLRLAFLHDLRDALLFRHPALDSHEYLMAARAILSGRLLWQEMSIHSPLYAYVLAGLLAVFGQSLLVVRVAQALLVGVGGCAAAWGLARTCGGRVAAAVSVWLAATLWPLVYHDGEILVESLVVLLNTLALLALVRARGRRAHLAAAGILLGLSTLTRPNAAAFVPVAALWAGWAGAGDGARAWRGAVARAAAVGLPAALVIAPLLLHNHAISGRWILQSNSGVNFYQGNSPGADGTPNIRTGRPWTLFVRMATARGITAPAAQDAFYWEAGLRWWREEPARALALFARKVFLFWNAYETRSSFDVYYFRRLSPTLALPWPGFGLLAPLALVGVGVVLARRSRETGLLVLYVATYTLATAAFMVSGRYRLPVLSGAVPLAGIAVARLVELARQGNRPRALAGMAAVLALALLVQLTPADVRVTDNAEERYNEGTVLLALGQLPEAERTFREAWAERQEDGRIANNLGTILIRSGRVEESLIWFRRAVAVYPEVAEAWSNLAVAAAATGHAEEAGRAFRESLRINPRRAATRLAAGLFWLERGDRAQAAEHLREARRLGAELPPVARALLEEAPPR